MLRLGERTIAQGFPLKAADLRFCRRHPPGQSGRRPGHGYHCDHRPSLDRNGIGDPRPRVVALHQQGRVVRRRHALWSTSVCTSSVVRKKNDPLTRSVARRAARDFNRFRRTPEQTQRGRTRRQLNSWRHNTVHPPTAERGAPPVTVVSQFPACASCKSELCAAIPAGRPQCFKDMLPIGIGKRACIALRTLFHRLPHVQRHTKHRSGRIEHRALDEIL